jgi:hypothetical protein
MTPTEDCPQGRSQNLTSAESDDKIFIDKEAVNKLTELLINSICNLHEMRRSEIFLASLDLHLSHELLSKKGIGRESTEKSLILLDAYQEVVPPLLKNIDGWLRDANNLLPVFNKFVGNEKANKFLELANKLADDNS